MGLKQRVEKLEELQKQNTCTHSGYNAIEVKSMNNYITVSHTCLLCNRTVIREGIGEELKSAERTLRNFILEKDSQ